MVKAKKRYFSEWFDNDSIYNPEVAEELLEEDGISPEEEAFMVGYEKEYKEEREDYY